VIERALVCAGPDLSERSAAYTAVLGSQNVSVLDHADTTAFSTTEIDGDVIVDVPDPDGLPAGALANLADRGALLMAAAPPEQPPAGLRVTLATPDVVAGPLLSLSGMLGGLGVRTMTKAVILAGDGVSAPSLFRGCLALAVLGGPIERLAARERDGRFWSVGRFVDGSIAYLEAGTRPVAGTDVELLQALGRDRTLEYDSRARQNRVHVEGRWQPLSVHRESPYTQMLRRMQASDAWTGLPEHADGLRQAAATYAAVRRAADQPQAVVL
jgi:hypothetical protein